MARFRKPFFRPARGLWYVWHDGKQVKLGPDKEVAFTAWHELRSKPQIPKVTQADAAKLVVVIVDAFLDWCEKNRAPNTYIWYKERLTHQTHKEVAPPFGPEGCRRVAALRRIRQAQRPI